MAVPKFMRLLRPGIFYALKSAMNFLIPYFCISLSLLLSLSLNQFGNWSHQSSEQLRLDALSLSLCHHRKNFLKYKLEPLNRKILSVRRGMNRLAPECSLAPAASKAAICSPLFALSFAGKAIEVREEELRTTYPLKQEILFQSLVRANSLRKSEGLLKSHYKILALRDGLSRESLLPQEKIWEEKTQASWPRRLIPKSSFEEVHRMHHEFFPKRILIGIDEKRRPAGEWIGLNPVVNETGQNKTVRDSKKPESESKSDCRVRAQAKLNPVTHLSDWDFQVKREADSFSD